MTFEITDKSTLRAIRARTDLSEVVVRAAALKYRGLLPIALKYALWATAPGGRILIADDNSLPAGGQAYDIPHGLVRSWTYKFIGSDVATESLEPAGTITLRRTAPVLAPGWSVGVVFSGNDGEIPALNACLDAIAAQDGVDEIAVCGPTRDMGFLADRPNVRYVLFDPEPGPRIPLAAKKNVLIDALTGPRVAILHTRILLEPGALAAIPREFDITTPKVMTRDAAGRAYPYLSLSQSSNILGRMPTGRPLLLRHVGDDILRLHEQGMVFVDGGIFCVTKAAHALCRLDDRIGWNEAEDVEWCQRAWASGLLVDVEPEAIAFSTNSKISAPPNLGPLTPLVATTGRALRDRLAQLRSFRRALTGRR